MKVGEVRIAEDEDFFKLRTLCEDHSDWKVEYEKSGITVWSRPSEVCDFKMIKVKATFNDVSSATVFDVLSDPLYRKNWDLNAIESHDICYISPNNDIGYYSMKLPKPLKNRDFVLERSWLDLGKEYLIFSHSINHASHPPKKNFIRGISYVTGYQINSTSNDPKKPGTCVTYISQADPRGKLPSWVVNKTARIFAPKVLAKVHKACKNYPKWKHANNPTWKPWLYPEQITIPKLDWKDILPLDLKDASDVIDETGALEDSGDEFLKTED